MSGKMQRPKKDVIHGHKAGDIYRPLTIQVQRRDGRKIRIPMEWVQSGSQMETVKFAGLKEMERRMKALAE